MKFIAVCAIALGIPLAAQMNTAGKAETKGACSPAVSGSNNTFTFTCYGVDRVLAEQIRQIVANSKRDRSTLKIISEKLTLLLGEVHNQPSVTSFNQQGGITAGQVTIQQGQPVLPPRRISAESKPEIIRILSEKSGKVRVSAITGDPESFDFAQDWFDVLKAAKWEMADQIVRAFIISGRPWTGVNLQIHGTPVLPGGSVQMSNDSATGHLARVLQLTTDLKDITANPTLEVAEGYVEVQIGPHPANSK